MIKKNKIWIVVLIVILILAFFGGYGMMNIFRGQYEGYYSFGWLFGIIAIVAAIWVIYDVLVNNKRLSNEMKLLWIIFAIIFSVVTAIVYYLLGRDGKNDLFIRGELNNKKFRS
jgi:hypothetical protein